MSLSAFSVFVCALASCCKIQLRARLLDVRGPRFIRIAGAAVLTGMTPCLLWAQGSVFPTSLNWVSVPVGGIGGQKVITLRNSGATSISISSISFGGSNPGDFRVFSRTCGSSLAAAASCTANVVFAPTATGNRSATLDFNDSASNSPQGVALTGYGAPGSGTVSVSPTSLSFGTVNPGSSSAANTVKLSNGTSSSITISGITVSGGSASDFSISSKSCGTSLGASGSCSVSVVFKPTASGSRSATLSFTDSASNSPQITILSGTAGSTSGSASVSPSNLNWVSVPIGGIGGQKVATLTNSGSTTVAISGVTLGGANPGDFRIYSKTCGSSLAASGSCTANVVFAPTAAGNRSATLNFNDGATNSPQMVTLTGYAPGGVSVIPTALSFASTAVGSSSGAQTVTLKNGLSSSVTISSVAIGGANASDFAIASRNCGASLAASGSCTASVVFKPTAAGTRTAFLSFTDSASNSPQTVALTGTGAGSTSGSASVTPTSLNWVSVPIGGIGGQKVATLTNSGSTTVAISGVTLGGANPHKR
jgi:trimeric autotransporter adhesin